MKDYVGRVTPARLLGCAAVASIILRKGRVRPVWAGHPWIFAQAVADVQGAPSAGDLVDVHDPEGHHLGRGLYSPRSSIVVRIITRRADEELNPAFVRQRLERSVSHRQRYNLPSLATDAYRVVHAEGDGLPGLIVDRYRDVAVVQLLTIGMKKRQSMLVSEILRTLDVRSVVEVPGGPAQQREGITDVRVGVIGGDEEVSSLRFTELGIEHEIEIGSAQKTGYFLDQRANRARVASLASGKRVLDLFAYVGGFGLLAGKRGAAEVLCVDRSAAAVMAGASAAARNECSGTVDFLREDVKRTLSRFSQTSDRFDIVVLDPPKLAPTTRHLARARKAYRRLNANAMRLVSDGGLLVSCSCSAAITLDDLLRELALAGRSVNRSLTITHVGQQGEDHPVPAAFPEGRYLKCVFAKVLPL